LKIFIYRNSMIATIQISIDGKWVVAGTFEPAKRDIAKGIAGGGLYEYDSDFVLQHLDDLPPWRVGLRYPVNFELYRSGGWPAFLLDLLPSGAGRRVWARRLGLKNNESADWQLLLNGAGNPPGNLRVAEAVIPPSGSHPGFTEEEIIEKKADFIEYAEARGAVVTGATDVAGDAPKFLLARDRKRRWHPDGSLEDRDVLDCWLVKFPRGKTKADLTVLRNEAPYYEVARSFGIRTGSPLRFIDGALFIPRFDRTIQDNRLIRHGLETLCSAAGIAEYGRRGEHSVFCSAIASFATDKKAELREYLRREILNVALRNTDNHGRNGALLKYPDGTVMLSPLYDFAPMFLDPEGIPRSSRWGKELEPTPGRPDWGRVAESFFPQLNPQETRVFLADHSADVEKLPDTMRQCRVEEEVIEGVAGRCAGIAADLREAGKG
jgi:serine/threonine-protein kinase HipA